MSNITASNNETNETSSRDRGGLLICFAQPHQKVITGQTRRIRPVANISHFMRPIVYVIRADFNTQANSRPEM